MSDDWLYHDAELGFGLRRGAGDWQLLDPLREHEVHGEGLYFADPTLPVYLRVRVRRRVGATLERWITDLCDRHRSTHQRALAPRELVSAAVERQRVRFQSIVHTRAASAPAPQLEDYLVVRRDEWFYELLVQGELPRESRWREELLRRIDAACAAFELDLRCVPRTRLPPLLPLDLEEQAWREAERFVHLGFELELRTPRHWCAMRSPRLDLQRLILRYASAEPGLDALLDVELDPLDPEDLSIWRAHLLEAWGEPASDLGAQLGPACLAAWRSSGELAEAGQVDLLHAAIYVGRAAVTLRMELGSRYELPAGEASLVSFAECLRALDVPALERARSEHLALSSAAGGWDPAEAEGPDWSLRAGCLRDEALGFELEVSALGSAWRWRARSESELSAYLLSGQDVARGFRAVLRTAELCSSLNTHHAQRVGLLALDAEAPRRGRLGERPVLTTSFASAGNGLAPDLRSHMLFATIAVERDVAIELELEGPERRSAELEGALEVLLAHLRFDLEPRPRVRATERGWEFPRWGLAFELDDEAWVSEREASSAEEGDAEVAWYFQREKESFGVEIGPPSDLAVGEREARDRECRERVAHAGGMEVLEERALPEAVVLGQLVRGSSWRYRLPSEDGGEPALGVQSLWLLWLGRKHVWLRHFQPDRRSFGEPAESAPLLGGLRWL